MSPGLICFGEALTDLLTTGGDGFRALPGGAPWNVARAAAALGLRSAWAGCISRDSFGDAIHAASERAGLDTRFIQRADAPPLLAVVDRLDPPHYFFIGEAAADLMFDESLLPAGWDRGLPWALFGGISLVREPLGARLEALARRLKAQGTRIAYDPNHRRLMQVPRDLPRLQAFCRLADLIKISDEDLQGFFPALAPDAALDSLGALNPAAHWLYTRGARGATLYAPGQAAIQQPARPVQLVDSVGAGDACLAGLLLAVQELAPRQPVRQLHIALTAAMLACRRAGAAAPTRAELLAAL